MVYTRCMGRVEHETRFYDKKLGQCPECGCPPGANNPHLYRTKLDSHLWAQAAEADKTKRQWSAIQRGYEIPPTKEQKKLAKQIVRDLL